MFADEYEIFCENQSGFRKDYSTIDNIFVLNTLFLLIELCKKKLFCVFVDFKAAFDKVRRNGLWYILLNNDIKGKCFNLIVNIYYGTKSRICINGCNSDFFICTSGVRQVENMSPFLFALCLNDLENYFFNNNVLGLTSISDGLETKLNVFLKLFLLLYADDTILMSESKNDLQYQLDCFFQYCKDWKLTVNFDKTKVVVFFKR